MKKQLFKISIFTFVLTAALFFTGCPVNLTITQSADDELSVRFSTIAGKATYELIASFDGRTIGTSQEETITMFDTIEIERSLYEMDVNQISATTRKTPNNEEQLDINFSCAEKRFDFIKITKDENNNATKMEITLSPSILQSLIPDQNSVIQRYADLLMAPCFTDEPMEKSEYIELVASLYGDEIAKELTSGTLNLKIKNARIKKMTQGISIPLIDILTLTSEKTFTVNF